MSATTENTTASLCDQLLDYAYDELAGEAKAAFEQHLATCAKCQTELQQLKRVRGAVKAVLPTVEPPANATGALHAQLLHAAAQRASGGGKVIPFGRRVQKVMMSPAFLAAAMFVIVGGAAGTLWYRGHIMMPAPEAAAPPPLPTAPAGTVATATPTPSEAPVAAAEKPSVDEAERKVVAEKAKEMAGYDKNALANEGAGGENKLYLDGIGKDAPPMPVHRAPPATRAHAAVAKPAPEKPADSMKLDLAKTDLPTKKAILAEPAPAPKKAKAIYKDSMDDSLGGLSDGTIDARGRRDRSTAAPKAAKREAAPAGPQGGGWNGNVGGVPPQASSAPTSPPTESVSQHMERGAATGAAPSPPPAAMPQSVDGKLGTRSSSGDATWRNTTSSKQQAIAAPSAQQAPSQGIYGRSNDALKQKAVELADKGRCSDAVPLFQQVMRDRSVVVSVKERVKYIDCLRLLKRTQQATEEMDALKQEKSVNNRMIQDEQKLLDQEAQAPPPARMAAPKPAAPSPTVTESESRAAKGKKKAAPAAVDSAPAQAKPGL